MSYTSETELTACCLCGGQRKALLAKVFSSPVRILTDLVRCRDCGLGYLFPRPSREYERKFYEKEYFERADFKEWKDNRVSFFSFALKELNKLNVGEKKILDVGCGAGFFLDMVRQIGWQPSGLELSELAVKYAMETLALPVQRKEIKDANLEQEFFDVVTLWNVLDQMWDPVLQIDEIKRVIKPGGILALRVTNLMFHLYFHRLYEFLKMFHFIRRDLREPTVFHLSMFDEASITKFLVRAGFADIKVHNSPLDAEPQVLVSLMGEKGARFVTGFCYLLAAITQILTRRTLGPSLFITAKKI